MAHETAAGASISFSAPAPATFDDTGYAALTWTTAAEVTNIGSFGKEFNLVTHLPLSSRGVKKTKGSFNNGTLTPSLAFDPADGGQTLLETAAESDDPIYARVTTQSGVVFYLEVLVMSFRTEIGEADSIVMGMPTMEVTDRAIVRV